MAFTVNFYTFSKKENSTARPSGSGTSYDCVLVRGSGVLEPVIELKIALSSNPSLYNYAYIAAFERYYYISEWTFEGALWRARMTVDALATWKTTIGSQSFYVLRASAQKDGTIMDTMYPVKDTYTITGVSGGTWFSADEGSWLTNGYFVVGLLSWNNHTNAIGGVNYYAMLPGTFNVFMQKMFDVDGEYATINKRIFNPISEYTNEQKANLLYVCENPYNDYIKSVTWVPDAPVSEDVYRELYLGSTQFTALPYKVVDIRKTKQYVAQFTIPKHPLSATRGSYTNLEPFTEMYLKLPKLGTVPIDPSYFANAAIMNLILDIDPVTGEGLFRLGAQATGQSAGYEIMRWYAPIGVSVSIAQGKEYGTRAEAVGQLASSVLNSLKNPGSIAALPAAIASVERAYKSAGPTLGNNGGWLGLSNGEANPYLYVVHRDITADDNAQNGRPLCQVVTPASLGGYMMVQDADIQAAATSQELAAIKSYMESGFYYE